MCFCKDGQKNSQAMIRLGLVLIVVANVWPRLIHATFGLGPDWVDGVRGALFGASFGLLVWGARKACRQRTGR